jgi:hypothetical protein
VSNYTPIDNDGEYHFWSTEVVLRNRRQSLATANNMYVVSDAQAIFCRRRHQPSRPAPAKIRPGRPAPTMGGGHTSGDCRIVVSLKAAKIRKAVAQD